MGNSLAFSHHICKCNTLTIHTSRFCVWSIYVSIRRYDACCCYRKFAHLCLNVAATNRQNAELSQLVTIGFYIVPQSPLNSSMCYGKWVRLFIWLSLCLCITLQYCVKTSEHRGMWFSPSSSPVSLVFWGQEWLMAGRSCPGKIWVQRGWPVVKEAKLFTFCLINLKPYINR